MESEKEVFIEQLETILKEFEEFRKKSKHNDLTDLPKPDRQSLVTRGIASIRRISGVNSSYSNQIDRILEDLPKLHDHTSSIMGIVKGLKEDLKNDYLDSLSELIHSEIFADFLEMAKHLLENGYKNASAVVTGSTLESHIKKLCEKFGVSLEETNNSGDVYSKNVNRLNADLAKENAYSKLDQKSVNAWYDLRNKAAHAEYDEYTVEQVKNMISGVRDFITRNPA